MRWSCLEDCRLTSCPLLHHLERCTQDSSSQIRSGVSKRSRETSGPRIKVSTGGDELRFEFIVGDNFGEFLLDVLGIGGLTSDSRQGSSGIFDSSLFDKPSWRIGKEEETGTEDQSPSELNGDWDSVRRSVSSVLGSVDDTRSEQKTDGNGLQDELLSL